MFQTLNIFGDIWNAISGLFDKATDLIVNMKNLIKGLFDFITTNIYLIPSPFSEIIIIALGVITTIFIIKIVGVLL